VIIRITPQHIQGGTVGWLLGATYATVLYALADKKRVRTFKRTDAFNRRLVKEAWVYLPADVKDKIQDETKFYNISLEEDI
jgi:hypothetical protein